MKKLIANAVALNFNVALFTFMVLAILGATTLKCDAQQNGGFENWSPQYTYENPDHWETMNILSVFSNPISAFKATGIDKHSGNYALKLKSVFLNNNPAPGGIHDTIGDVFIGKVVLSPPSLKLGTPYTGRPEKMEFWSKYVPVGIDMAGAFVLLQKWNGTTSDTIGFGDIRIDSTLTYTFFQININYHSTESPDTITIGFASSYKKSKARVGSTLYIDDVALTGWVGINESSMCGTDEKVKIFPNPARSEINILVQIDEADNVQVMDASGKLIDVYKIQNYNSNINTALFAEGFYFYYIRNDKNGILTKGKFTVAK